MSLVETELDIELVLSGSLENMVSTSITTDFIFDFWRGSISLDYVNDNINPDSLTIDFTMWHQVPPSPTPHEIDALTGDVYILPTTTLIHGEEASNGEILNHHNKVHENIHTYEENGDEILHELDHKNVYTSTFSVFGENINNTEWRFEVEGHHIPEPPAISLSILAFFLFARTLGSRNNLPTIQASTNAC